MIPPAALNSGERAFVAVLRRRYPDAAFVLGDCPVTPEDPNVAAQVAASATADLHTVNESGQHLAPFLSVEAAPEANQRPARRNLDQGGPIVAEPCPAPPSPAAPG